VDAQQPTRVFISYAWQNRALLAQRVYDELKQGCDPWKDERRMRAGATWTREVAGALDQGQVVVALVSPGSNASEVCGWGSLRALRKNKHVISVLALTETDLPLIGGG
jgi:AbiTii/TIR domain